MKYKKSKTLLKITLIAAAFMSLTACQLMDYINKNIKTPISRQVNTVHQSTKDMTDACIRYKALLVDAQGKADKAEELNAILQELQSSPTEKTDLTITALEKSNEIEVDYKEKIVLEREALKEFEMASFVEFTKASKETAVIVASLVDISMILANKKEQDAEFYIMLTQALSCYPVIEKLPEVYSVLSAAYEYLSNQGDLTDEQKSEMDSAFSALDSSMENVDELEASAKKAEASNESKN